MRVSSKQRGGLLPSKDQAPPLYHARKGKGNPGAQVVYGIRIHRKSETLHLHHSSGSHPASAQEEVCMAPNGWFHRYPRIKGGGESKAQHVPEGIFEKCPKCGEALRSRSWKAQKVPSALPFRLACSGSAPHRSGAQEIATGLATWMFSGFQVPGLAKGRANTGGGMVIRALHRRAGPRPGFPLLMGGSMGSVYGA